MKDFVEHLPRRVNRILDNVANNTFEVKVDAIDEKTLMEGFQKVANRITVGLILASLIVGAALLMRVETTLPDPRLSRPRHRLLPGRGGRRGVARAADRDGGPQEPAGPGQVEGREAAGRVAASAAA